MLNPRAACRQWRGLVLGVAGVSVSVGCGMGRPAAVSPTEMPELEARLASSPDDGALLLRYGAALYAAGRCDSAVAVVGRGRAHRPADAVGPLVVGQCLERTGRYDEAIAEYRRFLDAHGGSGGASAVRGRELLARRDQATAGARQALAREAELGDANENALAVLPLVVVGDSSYQPLSRGLAQIITSDLALLDRFRLVERMQLGAVLQELQLGQTTRVETGTAARVGRLVGAGRMVQGLAAIPPQGETRLEANVVRSTGEVTGAEVVTGRFRDLMQLEKQLVLGLAVRLGYVLSDAEREEILENGTENLAAFLAYSRGLVATDIGDFNTAALHFGQAAQADPSFQAAQSQYEAAAAAEVVGQATASEVTTVSASSEAAVQEGQQPAQTLANAVNSVVGDVAATQAEQATESADDAESIQQATQQSTTTTAAEPEPTTAAVGISPTVTGTIRIIFRLP